MKVSFSIRLFGAGLVVAGMVSAANIARADDITFENADGSTNVSVTYFNGNDVHGHATYKTEATAAGYYHCLVNNIAQAAFCTDLNDNIYNGESWTADRTTPGAANGFAAVTYPGGVSNINAIDYIAQYYTPPPAAAAAQLAIWDLVEGGKVSKNGSSYTWGSQFSSDYSDIASVYAIEQAALKAKGPSNAIFERVTDWDKTRYGRPQDFVFADPSSPANSNTSIPEPVFFQMSALLVGGVFALRRRASRS